MEPLLDVLKALSDETRLRILNLLYDQELCVCYIVEVLGIPQTKVSRHLSYLKNAGLVSDRKQAQWVYYSVLKGQDTQFVDSLVYDNLRGLKQFNDDLVKLAEWLHTKSASCSINCEGE